MSLVKLANDFNEEQERSRWRNTGYGAAIGAGLGGLAGIPAGLLQHDMNESFHNFGNTGPRMNISKTPYVAAGVTALGMSGALGGATLGATTDVIRNINQIPREKVAADNSEVLLQQQQQMYMKLLEEQQKRQEMANLPTNYTAGLGAGIGTAYIFDGFNNRNPNQLKGLGIGLGAGVLAHTLANNQTAKERRYKLKNEGY